ncbi:MAG: Hsp20/alpha crystallin family protein [Propionibacteriaceae bacterium]|nr:Hsp20/alpha crystallin family protein [Propionibacteriaceae bacterium]
MATTNTYYDPFREFGRAINSAFRTPASVGMPMDLLRDKEAFVAKIDLPGVEPDSIDIDIEENTLTVRAERKAPVTNEETEWLTRERSTGTYARQLSLGNGVALDKIEADYNDGVLTITLPIAEQAKPRKVAVTRSGSDHTVQAEVEQ